MDLETAKKIIESSVIQNYIKNIHADAEAALDEMNTKIGGMGDYPCQLLDGRLGQ